ncbi:MAG: DUF4082 domain-containing protein, partial [Actinomycetota bacterium]|nr:DUF4082 domain-containing protein [Actinomycetota bacterium]
KYTVTVSGAANSVGQTMVAPYSWSFTTVSPTPPTVTSVTPAPGTSGVTTNVPVVATFNQAVTPSSVVFTLTDPSNAAVAGTVSYNAATNTSTFTPSTVLKYSTTYMASVSGATNSTGQVIASPYTWTFATVAAPAPFVISNLPAGEASGTDVGSAISARFNEAVTPSSVQFSLRDAANNAVSGTLSYNAASNTSIFTPAAPLAYSTTYTANVSGAVNTAGSAMTTPSSWSFTTAPAPPSCPCTVFRTTATPDVTSTIDGGSVELGMKFRSEIAGQVTGVRFYKGTQNTGIHVGNLWSQSGTLLATVTFGAETANGWQQANFAQPVDIAANTTYVVSYLAPNGYYSSTSGFFVGSGADNYPLHGLQSGVDGVNGVYKYGARSAFPASSYQNTNYWVDVVLNGSSIQPAPAVISTSPSAGATAVVTAQAISATFDRAVTPSSVVLGVTNPGGSTVSGTLAYDGTSNTSTFTPGASLAYNTKYTVTISGATSANGNSMAAPYSWTFTTAGAPVTCPCSVFSSSATPATIAEQDASAVELGMKFRADVPGQVTGVRFYKSAQNTGTHLGRLWSATGQLLATVTFSGESASGWQQAMFSTPVNVLANTTYVISYYTPTGYYSANGGYFGSGGADNVPLHGLAAGVDGSNGTYLYGSGGGYPANSWNNTNYWVDVVFQKS